MQSMFESDSTGINSKRNEKFLVSNSQNIRYSQQISKENSPSKLDPLALPTIFIKRNCVFRSTERSSPGIKEQFSQKPSNECFGRGLELIQINSKVLKRIQQKIYPLNKDLSKNLKLRKKNLHLSIENSFDLSDIDDVKQKSKLAQKKKTIKQNKKKHKNQKNKGNKSQNEYIKLQAKVQIYLKDKMKQVQKKLGTMEMSTLSSIFRDSSSKPKKIRQNTNQTNLKSRINSNLQQIQKQNLSSQQSKKQSELKKVLKLFKNQKRNLTADFKINKFQKNQDQKLLIVKNQQKNYQNLKIISLRNSVTLINQMELQRNEEQKNSLSTQQIKKSLKQIKMPQKVTKSANIKTLKVVKNKIFDEKQNVDDFQNFIIIPSKSSKNLNNELIKQMKEQLLDEKNNLMRMKMNHKKMIKKKNFSQLN